MTVRGFRSKTIARIYKEGEAQDGFEAGYHRGSSHYYLLCLEPGCNFMQALSVTQNDSSKQKIMNVVTQLRRHGFVWQGRGGEHTAPCLYTRGDLNEEAA